MQTIERAITTDRRGSDVYCAGMKYEIAVVDRWRYPHTVWFPGRVVS
jgi:hypothetical protein